MNENFDLFLKKLNSLHESIKFKYEWEVNKTLPFLDINIHRSTIDNKFNFSVYRKPTATGSYIHYFSQHSDSIKRSILFSMFLRAYRICDNDLINTEIVNIRTGFVVYNIDSLPYQLNLSLSVGPASW